LRDVAAPLFARRLLERTKESASAWRVITAADAGVPRLATITKSRNREAVPARRASLNR
jgi:hypothetical protein